MINILKIIIINPIILFFETIFQYVFSQTNNVGLSIIVLSITLNIILLPLYKRVDEIQDEENLIQKKLKPGVDKIKKTFKGNEQYMILQVYYKQNNYKPIYALRSLLPILLEIPFFIAAYIFLSNLACLDGSSFSLISNLGEPDGLLYGLNILPIALTVINIISCIIYTKNKPFKDKIQLFLIAIVFLVLLYYTPSGLAFYYLLNNLFSLLKNIVLKFVKKKEVINSNNSNNDSKLFIYCCIYLCILTGLLIPSQVLNASPEEFIDISDLINPLKYVFHTFLLSIGVFLVWINTYYRLMNNKIKKVLTIVMLSICICSLFNHLFFKQTTEIMSYLLVYENIPVFSNKECIINALLIIVVTIILIIIYRKKSKFLRTIICILCISMLPIVAYNFINVNKEYKDVCVKISDGSHRASFTLSKNKQNVVVIMLDRALSTYFPYILEEKPILKEQFAGFTYYPKTISFGPYTNIGVPPLYGGYEYMPEKMNERDDELLVDKHNEALKVMPVLFDSNNFDVSVFDPPYAGYKELSDLSIYNDYPNINTYNTKMTESFTNLQKLDRNLFCFSIVRISPTLTFSFLYDSGNYSKMKEKNSVEYPVFMDSYNILCKLPSYTEIINSNKGSFFIFQNLSTHNPTELQLPDYVFSNSVNNDDYWEENWRKTSIYNGHKLKLTKQKQMEHYHANMASMLKIGEWLDYLRENDVYDNTRIIIASDHGRALRLYDNLIDEDSKDMMMFNALLLVKDFNSSEFKTNNSYMTNADVPYLATKDIIQDPVNPFTNNRIEEVDKNNRKFNVLDSFWNISVNNGYRFMDGDWYSVHDDCLKIENWEKIDDPSK